MRIKEKAQKETGISRAVCSLVGKWSKADKLHVLTVSGRSMKPLLNEGMRVVVDHKKDSIKKGDIVLYLRNNKLILHRVLRTVMQGDNMRFLTKGDSAMSFDKHLVGQNEIIGVVINILNDNKTIDLKRWQWRSVGRIITIGSLSIGILTSYINKIINILFQYRPEHIESKDKEL